MSYLFESPSLILIVGVLLIAACGYLFVNTRQKGALISLLVAVALTLGCLAIERFVETPREQIVATLDGLADELEANNLEGVLTYLDPAAKEYQNQARSGMARYHITKAKITKLEIAVNEMMSPPSAEVKFVGVCAGYSKSGSSTVQSALVTFNMTLRQHGERRWVITKFTANVGMH